MSSLRNGNEYRHQTTLFTVEDQSQVGEVRRFALTLCTALDLDEVKQGRISIIINELGANLVKYAKGGQILVRIFDDFNVFGIQVLAIDSGPGIPNVQEALTDGFTTGSSPGTGLGSIKRQADEFDIYSAPGQGTVIFASLRAKPVKEHSRFTVGAISVAMNGEHLSGDTWCVNERDDRLSVIVADGLGHGPLAHAAAVQAIFEFSKNNHEASEDSLASIHKRLHGTRGAAVFLAGFREGGSISHLGVGNIRAVVQTVDGIKTLISQNGTAGLKMPTLKTFTHLWTDGYLIFHSDGINTRWDISKYSGLFKCHPAIVAAVIFRDFNRNSDDSTVIVIGKKSDR